MKLFVVMGLGQFGYHTAMTLYEAGSDVLAIDKDPSRVELIKDSVGQAVCMDATQTAALESMQVGKANAAVIAFGEVQLEASILACVALRDLAVQKVVARSSTPIHGRILKHVGAHHVIYPEKQIGKELARSLLVNSVLEETILPTGQVVANIPLATACVGKTLADLQLPTRHQLVVIGLHRQQQWQGIPAQETVLRAGDVLVVVGNRKQIAGFSAQQ
ncbi:MAG: TrkA family potassium uptake protein [Myxococcota bacterium]